MNDEDASGERAASGRTAAGGEQATDGGRTASGEKATDCGRPADGERAADGGRVTDGGRAADGERPTDGGRPAHGGPVADGGRATGGGSDPGPGEPRGGPSGPEYGQTWAYESIIGALPGIDLSDRAAFAIQFALFETGVLVLAAYYGLWEGALAGTVAVGLATAGSFEMLRISKLVRRADPPESYERAVFGSSIDVVLGVLAFIALVTYLFVLDPRDGSTLVTELLGERPPLLVAYLSLLVSWDVCYRIGTGWWASVVALWRSATADFDPEARRLLARADLETMGFGLLQLVLVPFLLGHPILLFAVVGHVVAVSVVTGLSLVALSVRGEAEDRATKLSP